MPPCGSAASVRSTSNVFSRPRKRQRVSLASMRPSCSRGCARSANGGASTPTRSRRPSEWAGAFAQLLQSIGTFSAAGSVVGEPALNSAEYQTLARWQELLAEFAALDRTVGRLAAARCTWQARTSCARNDIPAGRWRAAGASAGCARSERVDVRSPVDHGVDWRRVAAASRPNPLLPIELQRAAGMPGAGAATELQRARRQLDRLLQSAAGSHRQPRHCRVDRKVAPSPLISSFEPWVAPLACDAPDRRDVACGADDRRAMR